MNHDQAVAKVKTCRPLPHIFTSLTPVAKVVAKVRVILDLTLDTSDKISDKTMEP